MNVTHFIPHCSQTTLENSLCLSHPIYSKPKQLWDHSYSSILYPQSYPNQPCMDDPQIQPSGNSPLKSNRVLWSRVEWSPGEWVRDYYKSREQIVNRTEQNRHSLKQRLVRCSNPFNFAYCCPIQFAIRILIFSFSKSKSLPISTQAKA
jgi:hypothetical protein